jgi:hypothetical protein
MDSAEPAANSIELNVIKLALKNPQTRVCDPYYRVRDARLVTFGAHLTGIFDCNQWMMNGGHLIEDSEERKIAHK